MEWSATSATKAYLDTIKLVITLSLLVIMYFFFFQMLKIIFMILFQCKHETHKRRRDDIQSRKAQEPGSSEFVSALAAGMRAKLIIEVAPVASPSTIALAAAARHTGGRLVCILPEPDVLAESKRVIGDSGLKDLVEFETGDPAQLLARHSNVDFSLVNCDDGLARVLGSIDVNPRRSVVVAKNFSAAMGDQSVKRAGLGLGLFRRALDKKRLVVRSVKQYPIGKGMEVITVIERSNIRDSSSSSSYSRRNNLSRSSSLGSAHFAKKSKWVARFDEESGEEHIFRVPLPSP